MLKQSAHVTPRLLYRLSPLAKATADCRLEPDALSARSIIDGLKARGEHGIRILAEQSSLARQLYELRTDVMLIDITNPSRDVLEELGWPRVRQNARRRCSWTGPKSG